MILYSKHGEAGGGVEPDVIGTESVTVVLRF